MNRARPRRRRVPPPASGAIVEIFSGIQGEGVHVGERHLFIRLAGCDFGCDYCDQPEARGVPRCALVERRPGRRDFAEYPNPLTAEQAAAHAQHLAAAMRHRAAAITGGEPLSQPGFLAALLPILRRCGMRVLLETNGTRPEALAALRGQVDVVSMDLKLRSATGRPFPKTLHERFLAEALRGGAETYAKAVVSERTQEREIRAAARLVAAVRGEVPLVIQPVSGRGRPPSADRLLRLQDAALGVLADVRVIPQTHKMMGQR